MGRFDNQDRKLDKNIRKMDSMGLKLERLESQSKKYKKDNKQDFTNIRKEIAEGFTEMEEKMTDKVVEKIKPKITELEVNTKRDMRNVLQEEIGKVDIPS